MVDPEIYDICHFCAADMWLWIFSRDYDKCRKRLVTCVSPLLHKPREYNWNVKTQIQIDAVCIKPSVCSAFALCFLLLASFYIGSGVLFTINSNLPSKEEEFAQRLPPNSLLDGYKSLLNQTALGMCFTDMVPYLFSLWLYGLDFFGLDCRKWLM